MKPRRPFINPVMVVVAIQLVWITLVVFWIWRFVGKHREFRDLAEKYRPELLGSIFNWPVMVEGLVMLVVILIGVYVMFAYWNRQSKLYAKQRDIISQVTHELKSPLASIQLHLETIRLRRPAGVGRGAGRGRRAQGTPGPGRRRDREGAHRHERPSPRHYNRPHGKDLRRPRRPLLAGAEPPARRLPRHRGVAAPRFVPLPNRDVLKGCAGAHASRGPSPTPSSTPLHPSDSLPPTRFSSPARRPALGGVTP